MAVRNRPYGATPMDPGVRDRRVTIQQKTDSAGSSGFPVETWSELDTVWAYRDDQSGSEVFRASQLSARGTARWEIGYRADMDPDLVDVPRTRRLVFHGRAHDIVAASHIGRGDGVELTTLAKLDEATG